MQQHQKGISSALNSTRSELESLHADISRALDKIGAREKYLNGQLEPNLADYRKLQASISNSKGHSKFIFNI
jgi:hypothetical protein